MFTDESGEPLVVVDPPGPLLAGEVVTVTCEGQGGNPAPTLTLYLGADQLGDSAEGGISQSFVVGPQHEGMALVCQAVNSVMESPAESTYLLNVLCKCENRRKKLTLENMQVLGID